jgi:hypothetical protein
VNTNTCYTSIIQVFTLCNHTYLYLTAIDWDVSLPVNTNRSLSHPALPHFSILSLQCQFATSQSGNSVYCYASQHAIGFIQQTCLPFLASTWLHFTYWIGCKKNPINWEKFFKCKRGWCSNLHPLTQKLIMVTEVKSSNHHSVHWRNSRTKGICLSARLKN